MNLYDIIACPLCKNDLQPANEALRCVQCGRSYPLVNDVPILLPDPSQLHIQHEAELILRKEYDPWVPRMVLQSLTDAQIVVDAGCGNMELDDPCLIRMDVVLTPYVDVVGDLHAIPFKPGSIDFIFSLAVVEHLRHPFLAADQMYKTLKPGGYVYGECNFIFAYHGYPHHYFNATLHGMKQIFSQFREIRIGVAPYQMPSFALQNIIGNYLHYFQAETPSEARFANILRHALEYPLHRYDLKFPSDVAYKLAAGVYFFGQAQPNGDDSLIPPPIWDTYQQSPTLQARFPDPHNLAEPDNLMIWAWTEGRQAYPAIDRFFAELKPFSKYRDRRPFDRAKIRSWPPIPHPDEQRIEEPNYGQLEESADRGARRLADPVVRQREPSLWDKAVHTYRHQGMRRLLQETIRYARRKLRLSTH